MILAGIYSLRRFQMLWAKIIKTLKEPLYIPVWTTLKTVA